ncbi:MAG: peptide-methionine (S)-S-oxide reductase MsrA [Pseudolabrys sp.]|nr:peptide-methionine (S)-S-oxide reductase MsrA [Pseudolabrys sp.]
MRRFLMSFAVLVAMAGLSGVLSGLAAIATAQDAKAEQAVAIFAGGCFWCTESDFDHVAGVLSTTSGYIGGSVKNPSYRQVSAGGTGHAEAVKIVYDPGKVSYRQLLTHYWHSVDPTVKNAQFCDHGSQYRTAIFVRNEAERKLAEASKQQVAAELKKPIYTEIAAAGTFYAAEDYHQDFYKKSPTKYKFYRWNCGRDRRLKEIWGAPKGDS